jgi:type II secretory ATPase GspE/PulE/Tfp pilus assembly ATPase PilB-like protein
VAWQRESSRDRRLHGLVRVCAPHNKGFPSNIEREAKNIKEAVVSAGDAAKELAGGDNEGPSDEPGLKKLAEDLPIVRIVDTLLSHAIVQKASDIHIENYERFVKNWNL